MTGWKAFGNIWITWNKWKLLYSRLVQNRWSGISHKGRVV